MQEIIIFTAHPTLLSSLPSLFSLSRPNLIYSLGKRKQPTSPNPSIPRIAKPLTTASLTMSDQRSPTTRLLTCGTKSVIYGRSLRDSFRKIL